MKPLPRMPTHRRLAQAIGRRIVAWANNEDDADIRTNGERRFLAACCATWAAEGGHASPVVVDAGANAGDYTAALLDRAALTGLRLRVLALEPGAAPHAALTRRFAGEPSVEAIRVAVSDRDGEAMLLASEAGAEHASLYRRSEIGQGVTEQVPLARLDGVLDARGIGRVDLLKLDVEGAELAALRGLGVHLEPARCRMIQFEYGGTTLDAGGRLRDFHDLLEARGYVVCRMMPHAIVEQRFSPWMETFRYANFVAVASDSTRCTR